MQFKKIDKTLHLVISDPSCGAEVMQIDPQRALSQRLAS